MPVRQRCLLCRAIKSWDLKTCSCGATLKRYAYLICEVNGRRRTRTLGKCTRTEAEEIYQAWKLQLIRGTTTPPPPPLKEICDAHIDRMKAEGKVYWKKVQLFFERAVNFFGNIPATEITPVLAQRFKTLLDSGSLSPAYVDCHIAELKAAWNTSLDLPNPFRRVKLNHPDNTIIETLTLEEEKRLLDAAKKGVPRAPKHLYEIVLIAIHTGLRRGDILRLHSNWIDFEHRLILVPVAKTDKVLPVPMNETVMEALQRIRPLEPGYYFPSHRKPGRPYTRFEGAWASLKKAAGITKPFRVHGLRHHFGTTMLKATGNPAIVCKLMGHSSIAVTEKYMHVLMEDMRAAVAKLDRQIGSTNSDPPSKPLKVIK